jgi:hypothetical protein
MSTGALVAKCSRLMLPGARDHAGWSAAHASADAPAPGVAAKSAQFGKHGHRIGPGHRQPLGVHHRLGKAGFYQGVADVMQVG